MAGGGAGGQTKTRTKKPPPCRSTFCWAAPKKVSQDVETHALSKPIIRIWRQQKCNPMKLLVQGWSESTCKLYDFVLTEIGDNEGEVLCGFKSGYFHPAKVIFVDAESSGLGTR